MSTSTQDVCIYCESTVNVYVGRCEDCAVTEFDNEHAHGRSPLSQHSRPAFTVRGTCSVCGLTDVCGRMRA